MLSDQDVREFQQLYLQKYGKQLSDDEARRKALAFVELLILVNKELPSKRNSEKTALETERSFVH